VTDQVAVEAVTTTTPRPLTRILLTQRWRTLTFVHWAVDPARVAPLLPPGTHPDLHDSTTFVGLIGFEMVGLGFGRLPGVPYFGTFPETNVRLYSVDDAGRRGVVFRSLDITRLVTAAVSRTFPPVPYMWSAMDRPLPPTPADPTTTYTARRRWPGPAGTTSRFTVRPGAVVAEPSPLEEFLTARWGLHTTSLTGHLRYLPNAHESWPLQRAELVDLDDGPHGLVAAAGLPGVTEDPPTSVLYSAGVAVQFGPPLLGIGR
jgi:uncharacterized protein YqjF (DUF2071 family)